MLQNKKIFLKILPLSSSVLAMLLSFFLSFPAVSHAETHVRSEDLERLGTWNKAGSPYILDEPIHVSAGSTLYIGEGVEIVSGSFNEEDGPNTLTINGDITVAGSKEKPVKFNNLYTLYFSSSNSSIQHAIFDGTGMDFRKSTSTIDSITITNAFEAIYSKGSVLKISNGKLINNSYGIASYNQKTGPIFQVKRNSDSDLSVASFGGGIGGIGNALIAINDSNTLNDDDVPAVVADKQQNIISINNSVISGNSQFGILNQTVNSINARDVWWGNANGPFIEGSTGQSIYGDRVSGLVDVMPWKDKEPKDTPASLCCSNILFIPGFEASRLYRDKNVGPIKTQDMLWEPNVNSDITDLKMDAKGASINKTIYTKDIMDSAYGLKNIYKNFIASLDKLAGDGIVKKWEPLAYDWRKSVTDIADDSALNKIYSLASTSKNSKVTIIAHSNGGLVTKSIMQKLEKLGKSGIVERILFIAVPELGTPQALLGMLHGYNQSIAGGFFMSEGVARTFSQNLPGAYSLLPSRKFFENNPLTVISDMFSGDSEKKILSYTGMKDFLLNNSFSKKSSANINVPVLLNSSILTAADSIHNLLDNWKPASSTKTMSIIGWGLPTSSSVTYKEDVHCALRGIRNCDAEFIPTLINEGDGTVITKSNSGNSSTTLFFNLKELKKDTDKNIDHANILESPELFAKIKDMITDTAGGIGTAAAAAAAGYNKYFSTAEPIDNDIYLTLVIHSPVDVDIYDKQGRHTGPADVTASTSALSSLDKYENEIPGSYYGTFGSIKLARIPYNPLQYQVVMSGTDAGVFSVDASISKHNEVIASTTFSEMPVTPLMNVDLIMPTSTESFKTDIKMNTDIDGDGITDFINRTDQFLNASGTPAISDLPTYLESLRKIIISLKLPENKEKVLLKRLDNLEKIIEKKRFRKAEKVAKRLSGKIFKIRKINEDQRSAVMAMAEELLSRLEKEIK